jgi:hypothetical protein
MAGYIRQSSFVDGDTITAALFNDEYNQLVNAFSNTDGHKHDGTTAEGPVIGLIGDAGETSPNNKVLIDTTNNYIEFYVEVSSAPVQQLYIADGAIIPVTDSDIDLGTASLEFKDLYIDGTANIDSLVLGSGATVTAILDEDTLSSDSATALATQQSIKAYVDSQVTAQDLDFQGDSGGALSIDLDSETLTIAGGTGIDTVGATNTLTVSIDSTVATLTGTQTLTNKTLTSPDVNTPDIDGGTIDNTVIGGTTPAAGTFTTLTANTSITGTLVTAAQTNITSVGTLTGLTVNGDATFTGASYNAVWDSSDNALKFADNAKATFGDGDDLQIYHDGSDSYIDDAGVGDLVLRGNNQVLIRDKGTNDVMVNCVSGQFVKLYYNNAEKLATTSTGIDVTGDVVADGLTVDGNVELVGAALSLDFMESDQTDKNLRLRANGGVFSVQTLSDDKATQTNRLQISHTTGDVSFYEDTGTTQQFYWDASANSLGIGTTSPQVRLSIDNSATGGEALRIGDTSGAGGTTIGETYLGFTAYSSGTTQTYPHAWIGVTEYDVSDQKGILTFGTRQSNADVAPTEAMRIDNSGNLLVGKTSTAIETVGTTLFPTGRMISTADGDDVVVLNRQTSDGDIAGFRKDEATVGTIGTKGGDLTIGTGDTGLRFVDGDDAIWAIDTSTGDARDDAVSLGVAGARFKDLYLSGGAYVGGTTSANYLDDYEEGTWTPSYGGVTTEGTYTYGQQVGTYVKIGRTVTITCQITNITATSEGSGNVKIYDFPFTVTNSGAGYYPGSCILEFFSVDANTVNIAASPDSNSNRAIFWFTKDGTGDAILNVADRASDSADIRFTAVYETDS